MILFVFANNYFNISHDSSTQFIKTTNKFIGLILFMNILIYK